MFDPLWVDLTDADDYPSRRPYLAHYTSLSAVEAILTHDQIWFSHPLLMNDWQEVRYGISDGLQAVRHSLNLKAILDSRHMQFVELFEYAIARFDKSDLFDTYIFCLSEHEPDDFDGLLSMWRGYGAGGNGAALVFDTGKLEVPKETPLILGRVHYPTDGERVEWILTKVAHFAQILAQIDLSRDGMLRVAADALFDRVKVAAMFSKHRGFREEKEWRIVYLRDRDHSGALSDKIGYFNGPRGIEPKLKLDVKAIEGATGPSLSMGAIIDAILLGPTGSNALSLRAATRMLESIGKGFLADRLRGSRIPYRTI